MNPECSLKDLEIIRKILKSTKDKEFFFFVTIKKENKT